METAFSLFPSLQRRWRNRPSSQRSPLSLMEDEMKRWLEDGRSLSSSLYEDIDFIPQCNLKETGKEFIARFDIPGVKKEDLKIEVDGSRVTVRGERKSEKEEKEERYYFSETEYGSFMRSFTLPNAIAEDKVDARYDNGVLTIHLPKVEQTKSKEVEVH